MQKLALANQPSYAVIFIDIDELGKKQLQMIEKSKDKGISNSSRLSLNLANFIAKLRYELEQKYLAVGVFGGGDEFLCLAAAPHALSLAEDASIAFHQAQKEFITEMQGEWQLTISLALMIVAPNRPLRQTIADVHQLMQETKQYQRPQLWRRERTIVDRSALGLAVVPGSGNIKHGIIGLTTPEYDEHGRLIGNISSLHLLRELAELISIPPAWGIEVSPSLLRDLLGIFSSAIPYEADSRFSFLPETFGNSGIFLAEIKRLAIRHLDIVAPKLAEQWHDDRFGQWRQKFVPNSGLQDKDMLKRQLTDALVRRIYSLAFAGSFSGNIAREALPWNYFSGLLLGILSLAREGTI